MSIISYKHTDKCTSILLDFFHRLTKTDLSEFGTEKDSTSFTQKETKYFLSINMAHDELFK